MKSIICLPWIIILLMANFLPAQPTTPEGIETTWRALSSSIRSKIFRFLRND